MHAFWKASAVILLTTGAVHGQDIGDGSAPPETTASTGTVSAADQPATEISGTLLSIDRQGGSTARVRLRDRDGVVSEYALDGEVEVYRDQQPVPLPEIHPGDRITLRRSEAS